MSWERLGNPGPQELAEARLQLHYAAQLVGAVGPVLLEPEPEYAHYALSWSDELRSLTTPMVPTEKQFRVGLRFADLSLFLRDEAGGTSAEKELVGMTLDEGLRWLIGAIADHTDGSQPDLKLAEHEMPEHPIQSAEPFSSPQPDHLDELGRWFANAVHVLQRLSANNAGATPVQVWPHHFDPSVVIKLAASSVADEARTITVGMSPGDGSYSEPYYYVTSDPNPEASALPDLEGGGHWHVEGWTGAVLTGPCLVAADDQEARLQAFLQSAIHEPVVLL